MRELYLTVGAPAIGKTTWIEENGLQFYAVSSDEIRSIISNYQTMIGHDKYGDYLKDYQIDYRSEHEVWNFLYSAVENRMKHGQTTFVDATHLYKGAFTKYNQLRIKYHYQVYLIDFMAEYMDNVKELSQTLEKRDELRMRHVGSNVIEKYINRYLNCKDHFPDWLHVVSPQEVSEKLTEHNEFKRTDMSKFDTVKVIGDVHGDYGALQKVFANHHRGVAYVFVGDYLDRGSKNAETLKFLNDLKGNNIFFLRGNHEWKVEEFLNTGRLRGNFKNTYPKLHAAFSEKVYDLLENIQKQLLDYVCFEDGKNHTYLVTHAGIEPLVSMYEPVMLMNEDDFVMGVPGEDEDPYNRDIDEQLAHTDIIQLHGHRNNFDHFDECKNAINLTKDGHFRWVDIDMKSGKITPHDIESIDGEKLQELLDDDPDVKNVELDDGIIANNFTREAFENNRWTPTTTNARGLFTRNNEVIGRGFKKFFEVGQTPDSTLASLGYPVKAYVKHNGFLAIVFYDRPNHQIRAYSKGGGKDYSQLANQMLLKLVGIDKTARFYGEPSNCNKSVLFEIVDPEKDPHIVKYDEPHAYPLAVINNDMNGQLDLTTAEKYWDINRWLAFTANNEDELRTKIEQWEQDNPTLEGLVLYGQNKMLKYKTKFYHKAKELRGALGNKHKKRHWYYCAEPWYDYCIEHDIHEFTPQLVLDLYELDV